MMASLRSLSLVAFCTLLSAAQVAAQPVCRPVLTVKQAGFSVQPEAGMDRIDRCRRLTMHDNERSVLDRLHPPCRNQTSPSSNPSYGVWSKEGGCRVLGRRGGSHILGCGYRSVSLS